MVVLTKYIYIYIYIYRYIYIQVYIKIYRELVWENSDGDRKTVLCLYRIYNSSRRREVLCPIRGPIQHGREYCKVLVIQIDVNVCFRRKS